MASSEGSAAHANISKAQSLKEEGNKHFKDGDYPKAIAAYHQIFMYVHGYSASAQGSSGGGAMLPGQTTTPVTVEEMALIKELKLAHFCNLAMCHLKHGPNVQKARVNCTKALELDPNNVKALFRRGKCHAQLGMLDEAKDDLERVLELQSDNKDAVRELRLLRGQFATQRKKEQKKFAGMFDRMQAEAEAEAEAGQCSEAASAGTAPAAPTSNVVSSLSACSAMPPEGEAGGTGGGGGDDDIGEPLGEPITFEPQDVMYASRASAA